MAPLLVRTVQNEWEAEWRLSGVISAIHSELQDCVCGGDPNTILRTAAGGHGTRWVTVSKPALLLEHFWHLHAKRARQRFAKSSQYP